MSLAERLLLPPEPLQVATPHFTKQPRHRARPRRHVGPLGAAGRYAEQPLRPAVVGMRLPHA